MCAPEGPFLRGFLGALGLGVGPGSSAFSLPPQMARGRTCLRWRSMSSATPWAWATAGSPSSSLPPRQPSAQSGCGCTGGFAGGRKKKTPHLDSILPFTYNKTAAGSFRRQTGRHTRSLRLPGIQTRQVTRMNAYEITMIVIASMTLLLKVIEVIYNLMKK